MKTLDETPISNNGLAVRQRNRMSMPAAMYDGRARAGSAWRKLHFNFGVFVRREIAVALFEQQSMRWIPDFDSSNFERSLIARFCFVHAARSGPVTTIATCFMSLLRD
jgi:hypothetical protein